MEEGAYLGGEAPPRVNMLAIRAPKDDDDEAEAEGVLLARTLHVLDRGAWRGLWVRLRGRGRQ